MQVALAVSQVHVTSKISVTRLATAESKRRSQLDLDHHEAIRLLPCSCASYFTSAVDTQRWEMQWVTVDSAFQAAYAGQCSDGRSSP